ncbi:TetR/AcrR family transcriptional regulator [Sorangium sp. So ce136]|uniref:TetR/AcrR family transcriptional regulator n=1 Tax=Sorangium sp. So ce136 TaxID=3133284 RepID=UPI003F08F1F2
MADRSQRRPQAERRDDAERRMLEAGVRLVAERGLEGFTLADVGKAAGFSRGLPAYHFGSKDDYQAELIRFITREYSAHLEAHTVESGLAGLVDLVRSFLDASQKDPIVLCVLQIGLSKLIREPAQDFDSTSMCEATLGAFEHKIREGVRRGEIRPDVNPRMLSVLLTAAIRGALAEWLNDRATDLVVAGNELIGLMVPGLAVEPLAGMGLPQAAPARSR